MNKNIGYYALGLCSLALATFAVMQDSKIEKQQKYTKVLTEKVVRQDRSIKDLEMIVDRYREENGVLVDSILELNGEIRELNLTIIEQDNIIKSLDRKLNKSLRKFDALEKQISLLESKEQDYSIEIARLEADKTQILNVQETTGNELAIAEERKARLEKAEVENYNLIQDKKKRLVIDEIVNNTIINMLSVRVGSKPKLGNLNKIKKNSSKWMYSSFEFIMTHPSDQKLIENEQFVLKIIDKDTGKILPYLEENPSFPESVEGTNGKNFRFTNNPIEVLHINTQKKEGKNYEARIYLVKNGEEYLLANSHRMIVNNRKVIN